ncbi:hypothetical protein F2P81_018744 [Scophthalmus maximus]|uniref:Uncharacterized protein n=1 Tax=Scophthalmus maximus TaxID=52904 RepID=A0A6A4SAK0_SCOMX|nr:hypothetical protein F2P81_018744 [Scophthalmus maximus]
MTSEPPDTGLNSLLSGGKNYERLRLQVVTEMSVSHIAARARSEFLVGAQTSSAWCKPHNYMPRLRENKRKRGGGQTLVCIRSCAGRGRLPAPVRWICRCSGEDRRVRPATVISSSEFSLLPSNKNTGPA